MLPKPASLRPLNVLVLLVLLSSGLSLPAKMNQKVAAGSSRAIGVSTTADPTHPGVSLPWERVYGLGTISAVALSPDEKRAVVGSDAYFPVVINLASGLIERTLVQGQGVDGKAVSVAYAPNGALIATGGYGDASVTLWDAQTGQVVRLLPHIAERGFPVGSLGFSRDGTRLISLALGVDFREAVVWNVADGQAIQRFRLPTIQEYFIDAAIAPDGSKVVTGDNLGRLQIWDVASGNPIGTPIQAHERSVVAVAFAPNGTRVLSAGPSETRGDTMRLWDIATHALVKEYTPQDASIRSVAFAPDGTRLLGADGRGKAWIYAISGALQRSLIEDEEFVSNAGVGDGGAPAVFSASGSRVLAGGNDAKMRLWEANTGELLLKVGGHASYVSSVAVSPDGTQILSGGSDGQALLWDRASGRVLRAFTGSTATTSLPVLVAFGPAAATVLTGGADGIGRLWNTATGELLRTFSGHTGAITTIAYAPHGGRVLTGGADGTARLWEIASGRVLRTFRLGVEGFAVNSVAIAPDGASVLLGGAGDPIVKLFDAASGRLLRSFAHDPPTQDSTFGIAAVAFSPNGAQILTGGKDDNLVRHWDVRTGRLIRTYPGPLPLSDPRNQYCPCRNSITAVGFSTDSRRVVMTATDGTTRIWDAGQGVLLRAIPNQSRDPYRASISGFAFTPDDHLLLGGFDGLLRLWNAAGAIRLRSLDASEAPPSALDFAPDGRGLVAASFQGGRVWDLGSGTPGLRFGAPTDGVTDVDVSPDGTLIATAEWRQAEPRYLVRLWDSRSGQLVRDLPDHGSIVNTVAFSPDGRRLLSGSDDGSARIWNVADGEVLGTITHGTIVNSVAWSPDGKRILTGGHQNTAYLWQVDTGTRLRSLGTNTSVGDNPGETSVAFAPDGKQVLVEGLKNSAVLWDVDTGERVHTFSHTDPVTFLGFAAGGQLLVVGTFGKVGTITFWERTSGAMALAFADQPVDIAVSPDGTLIATATGNNLLNVWTLDWGGFNARGAAPLRLDNAVEGRVPVFQWSDFLLQASAGQPIVVEVTPLNGADSLSLHGNLGRPPTFAEADARTATPTIHGTYQLLLTPSQSGPYYLGVFGGAIPGERAFRIEARSVARYLSDLRPRTAGNAGEATLNIAGLGFVDGMRVELRRSGSATRTAAAVTLLSATQLQARFDLQGAAEGSYAIHLVWPDNGEQSADNVFTITSGVGAKLTARVQSAAFVRVGRPTTVQMEITNPGDADQLAPLLILSGSSSAPLTASFKTACDTGFSEGPVFVLGAGTAGPAGTLPPGAVRTIQVTASTTASGAVDIADVAWNLEVIRPRHIAIDWERYQTTMRPASIAVADWDALWPTLKARLGSTWTDYLRVLGNNAELLRRQGRPTECVRDLLALEVARARGESVAAISGRVLDAETRLPLTGVDVFVLSDDGNVGRAATTGLNDGHFVFPNLPAGRYKVSADGYYFQPRATVELAHDQQRNDLALLARKVSEPAADLVAGAPPDPGDSHPVLVSDPGGSLYLVWQRGEELWQSRYAPHSYDATAGEWEHTMPITGALGVDPAATFDPVLGNRPGVALTWQNGDANGARLQYAIGRPDEARGLAWTQPVTLTGDNAGDTSPATIVGADGKPLVLWLQRDYGREDDLDLYSMLAPISGVPGATQVETLPALATAVNPAGSVSPHDCIAITLGPGPVYLPKKYPVIGGRYQFQMKGQFCATQTCTVTNKYSLETEITLTERLTAGGAAEIEATWETDPKACKYVFHEGSVKTKISETTAFPVGVYPIPPALPIVIVEVSAPVAVELEGSLGFSGANFPSLPDTGGLQLTLSGGLQGKATIIGLPPELAEGAVKGTISDIGTWSPPADFTLKACVQVEVEARAWRFGWKLEPAPKYCYPEEQETILGGMMPAAAEPRLVVTLDPLAGTGARYEGQPLLGNAISTDLTNDGKASLARSSTGEILAAWTKDAPATVNAPGSAVVVSTRSAGSWSAPLEIQSAQFFNQGAAVAYDGSDTPMVVWASAPAKLPPNASSDTIVAAVRNTNIMYSRRVNDAWTAPQPIAVLPGMDDHVQLRSRFGQLMAAWIHTEGNVSSLYSSTWDGSAWSTPLVIETGKLVKSLALDYASGVPVLVWTQDSGAGTEDRTFELYYAENRNGYWFPATRLDKPALAPRGLLAAAQTANTSIGAVDAPQATVSAAEPQGFTPGQPPKEKCCEEEPDKPENKPDPPQPPRSGTPPPPPPPGGTIPEPTDPPPDDPPAPPDTPPAQPAGAAVSSLVNSSDPNEKIGPRGKGAQRGIAGTEPLVYTIFYENKASAAAPAQEVFIVDRLDPDLDWSSLRFVDAVWGDSLASAEDRPYQFHTRQLIDDYRPDVARQWWLDITGELDPLSGQVRWTLRTLDPETGALPDDPFAGFLPPEDGTGRGQGSVTFSIRPRPDLPSGTLLANRADIIFDTNEVITTNEWTNTISRGTSVFLPMTRR